MRVPGHCLVGCLLTDTDVSLPRSLLPSCVEAVMTEPPEDLSPRAMATYLVQIRRPIPVCIGLDAPRCLPPTYPYPVSLELPQAIVTNLQPSLIANVNAAIKQLGSGGKRIQGHHAATHDAASKNHSENPPPTDTSLVLQFNRIYTAITTGVSRFDITRFFDNNRTNRLSNESSEGTLQDRIHATAQEYQNMTVSVVQGLRKHLHNATSALSSRATSLPRWSKLSLVDLEYYRSFTRSKKEEVVRTIYSTQFLSEQKKWEVICLPIGLTMLFYLVRWVLSLRKQVLSRCLALLYYLGPWVLSLGKWVLRECLAAVQIPLLALILLSDITLHASEDAWDWMLGFVEDHGPKLCRAVWWLGTQVCSVPVILGRSVQQAYTLAQLLISSVVSMALAIPQKARTFWLWLRTVPALVRHAGHEAYAFGRWMIIPRPRQHRRRIPHEQRLRTRFRNWRREQTRRIARTLQQATHLFWAFS
ncbi:uncharacterized protein BKA78DRAFT_309965 [Phyllosticta capitalensis]|uniref:uncharacterized protein n=1 Tax=Phyllosticta capitalensis TaxID=121624 RepID=UPI003130D4EF